MSSSSTTTTTSQVLLLITATATGAILGAYMNRYWYKSLSHDSNQSKDTFTTTTTTAAAAAATNTTSTTTTTTTTTTIPQHIRKEQLSRHELYFGETGMQQLQQTRICVVGLGGVGSHTVMALARAGIGYLRIIDHDQVTLSSLNRHAVATLAHVGTPKAITLQNIIAQICPDPNYIQVDARVEMYTPETAASLLSFHEDNNNNHKPWDLVIDAIDDVPTKAHLIYSCIQHNIRIISCMGAGGKSDFTRLCVSDLRSAAKDPLATKLKQTLKQLHLQQQQQQQEIHHDQSTNMIHHLPHTTINTDYFDDMEKLTVLYTSEKPVMKLADFTASQKAQGIQHFGAIEGMRIRILPVLGTTPAIMGQALAAWALTECGGKPLAQPVTGDRVGKNVRNKLYQKLEHREQSIAQCYDPERKYRGDHTTAGTSATSTSSTTENETSIVTLSDRTQVWIGPLQVDQDDIDYLMQVWRNRCAVTQARLGTIFHLVRWDISQPSDIQNLVLMSAAALQKYDKPGNYHTSWKDIPQDIRQKIEIRLQAIRHVEEF